MRAKFEIVSCQNDHVKFVELEGEFDCTVDDDHTCEALSVAGIRNYICDGCYDHAYRVKFVEIVEDDAIPSTMPIAPDTPKLQTGAEVMASRCVPDGWIVLARRGCDDFVTWCVDSNGSAFWGHYFSSAKFEDACQDWATR